MLSDEELKYISEGFSEVFGEIGEQIYYIPLIDVSKTKFGEPIFNYNEENKILLNVKFSRNSNEDADVTKFYTLRTDASITIINNEMIINGIKLKTKDAFDITNYDNTTSRFIMTGYNQDSALSSVFTKITITDFKTAFEMYRKEGI